MKGDSAVAERVFPTVVSASFSQFYLRVTGVSPEDIVDSETSITQGVDRGGVMFTSPIQDADLHVDVRLFNERPSDLDDCWKDVVEFSFHAGAETQLTGWEAAPDDLHIPLTPGESYRLRYAIEDMDTAREDHPGPVDPDNPITGVIAIDLWPAHVEPPRTSVQETKAGRYWLISHGLEHLRWDLYRRRSETTESERITEFADRAFAQFPDLVQATIDSNAQRLLSTAWMLHGIPTGHFTSLSRDEQDRASAEAKARISKLLLERARQAQTNI